MIQWIIDFTGVGEVVNEFADPIIGILMTLYFQVRGVSMIKEPKRLVAMILGDMAEQLTASVAPAWIIDAWYMHKTVVQEDAQIKAAKEAMEWEQTAIQQPLNQNGMRMPSGNSRPVSRAHQAETASDHIAPAPKPLNLAGKRRPA